MIEKLVLTNFQGFAEATDIPLAPLTLIFGPNSSGKSSIIRSLLLAQQSFNSFLPGAIADFRFKDRGVNLGSFANAVHRHDQSKKISVQLEIDVPAEISDEKIAIGITGVRYEVASDSSISSITLTGSVEKRGEPLEKFELDFVPSTASPEFADLDDRFEMSPRWTLTKPSEKMFREIAEVAPITLSAIWKIDPEIAKRLAQIDALAQLEHDFPPEYAVAAKKLLAKPLRWRSGAAFIPRIVTPNLNLLLKEFSKIAEIDDEESGHQLATLVRNLFAKFTNLNELIDEFTRNLSASFGFQKMLHVPATRPIPERIEVGRTDSLVLANSVESMKSISDWVSKLTDDTYKLEFIPLEGELGELVGDSGALVLKDRLLNTRVTFHDVGVGLSQVLPVLRALDRARPMKSAKKPRNIVHRLARNSWSTIMLEQPELHLHPNMQGKLVELFVDYLSEPDAAQIIAETHSEAMVLKIQAEVSAGRLSADSVAVLYVWKDKEFGGSRVKRLSLTDRGDFIDAWPESFSEIRMRQMRGD